MDISLKTQDGRLVLEVGYNPNTCDWSEAIRAGLAAYGIQPHMVVTVVARPARVPAIRSDSCPGDAWELHDPQRHGQAPVVLDLEATVAESCLSCSEVAK
jgi:hypothetical protein